MGLEEVQQNTRELMRNRITELESQLSSCQKELAEEKAEIERLKFYERYAEYADHELKLGKIPTEVFGFNIREMSEKESKP